MSWKADVVVAAVLLAVFVGWPVAFQRVSMGLPLVSDSRWDLALVSDHAIEEVVASARWGAEWRPFAAPVAIETGSTLLFQRDGQRAILWRIDWKTGMVREFSAPDIHVTDKNGKTLRFVSLATSEGVWLVGPDVLLIQYEREVIAKKDFGATQPVVAPLADGSVIVLGSSAPDEPYRVQRIRRSRDQLDVIDLGAFPFARRFEHSTASLLPDHRVLIAGGSEFAIYDPAKNVWIEGPPNPIGQRHVAILALPDGRALALGGEGASRGRVTRAALWDAPSNHWRQLPDLPISIHSEAASPLMQGATVLPDGSLLVGGGMDETLYLLRLDGQGWAGNWRVVGRTSGRRMGAILQALDNNDVVIAGGVYPDPATGVCCSPRPGAERVSWPSTEVMLREVLGFAYNEPMIAQRGRELFVAGGWLSSRMGSGVRQFSAIAELVDLSDGTSREMAALPEAIGVGQAVWLDEHRVLVKGEGMVKNGEYHDDEGRNLERRYGSGGLALYDRRTDRWQSLDDPRIRGAALAGVDRDDAILIAPDTGVWAVSLDRWALRALPRLTFERSMGVSRVLVDGRIVVAGGRTQKHLILVEEADCGPTNCPDRYAGFGDKGPANRYEIYDPARKQWSLSEKSPLTAFDSLILGDGRVVQIGVIDRPGDSKSTQSGEYRFRIERSSADGSSWDELPPPPGLQAARGSSDVVPCVQRQGYNACRLLNGAAPGDGSEVLFLKQVGQYDRYWMFDEQARTWVELDQPLSGRPVLAMTLALPGSPKKWRVGGFSLDRVVIWEE